MSRPLIVMLIVAFVLIATWAAAGAQAGIQTDYFKRVQETR